ncbi:MAG: TIGR00730 family Rossman fold protein [Oscillospiraceae bacterium]
MTVCVFGASSRELRQVYLDEAFKMGAELAKRGHSMVFGGGASGLMGAAARGVVSVGGKMTGIAPKFFDEPGILCKDCAELIFTETMGERKKLMEDMADAFIILPGGIGTLEEFFEALTLKQLGRHSKAMAILNTDGYYAELDALMLRGVAEKFTPRDGYALYSTFDTPAAVMDYIEAYTASPQDICKAKLFGRA